MFNVIDIWRLKHPNKLRYTWREKTRYGFTQSRIDYVLISCHLQYFTQHVDILPSIKSDHGLLKLMPKLKNEGKRGRGIWKLNTSLLLDDNYISHMKSPILKAIEDSKYLQNSF